MATVWGVSLTLSGGYGIFEDGSLMGVLDDDGNLDFPALPHPESLLDGADSIPLSSLRSGS